MNEYEIMRLLFPAVSLKTIEEFNRGVLLSGYAG